MASTSSTTGGDLDWLSTDDEEELVWTSGPDRRTLLPAVLVGIPLSIVLIGIVIIVAEYLRVTNTRYVVTTRGLYRKTGILSRDVKRIEHEKVQDISYSQSALGNRFGYGTVEVSTAGGAGVEMAFESVPNPRDVQQLIGDRLERHRERPGGRSGDRRASDAERAKDEVLTEILAELRSIRTTLEARDDRERSEPRDTRGTDETPETDETREESNHRNPTDRTRSDDSNGDGGTHAHYDERSFQS